MPQTKDSLTARWLWNWVVRERKRQRISRSEFARRLGIRRESLYRMETGVTGSAASTLLEALDQLGALGAVAEIGDMDWHGAVLSLSRHETDRYDAIAETNGITRGQVIRQLASEGLLARQKPEARGRRRGTGRLAFLEVGFWFNEKKDAIELRSVSKGESLEATVDRTHRELFGRLAGILREEGASAQDRP